MLRVEQLSHAMWGTLPFQVRPDKNGKLEVLLGSEMQAGATARSSECPSPSNVVDKRSRQLCSEFCFNGPSLLSDVTRILEHTENAYRSNRGG